MNDATPVRYVVAWGGDKRSQDALALGVDLSLTFGAGLDVLYVLQEESAFAVQHAGERGFRDRVEAQARARLRDAVSDMPAQLDVRVHVRRSASVAQGILDGVTALDAGMLIIGSGASSGTRFVANAVAGALLHASHVPVAMAPRRHCRIARGRLDELIVAVGTRPGAQIVVHEAVEAASRVGLPLRLVSLVDDATAGSADAARVQLEALRAAVDDAGGGDLTVSIDVGQGPNLKKALAHLDWSPRSALVVGSSRLAQGRQTFLGTTATRMLSHVPAPMIVVPRNDPVTRGVTTGG